MKKRILKYLINKLSEPRVSKTRYFWLRFWIEKFQDPEENYELIDRLARAVNEVKDSHVQYQLSVIVNDYFTCDNVLYIIINQVDEHAFLEDIEILGRVSGINIATINDRWTGQKTMYEHLIFNSLV